MANEDARGECYIVRHRDEIVDVPDVADDIAGEQADLKAGDDLNWRPDVADGPATHRQVIS